MGEVNAQKCLNIFIIANRRIQKYNTSALRSGGVFPGCIEHILPTLPSLYDLGLIWRLSEPM
jgi:hypothetical protein